MRASFDKPLGAAIVVVLTVATLAACGDGTDGESAAGPSADPADEIDRYAGAPLRRCADRVEAEGAEAGPVMGPDDLEFGAIFESFGFLRGGRPSAFFRAPNRRYGSHKLMFILRAGVRASLVVPLQRRALTGLRYVPATPVDGPFTVANGGAAVRFEACPADEPARNYDGAVGQWTEFNGDILLAKPGCHVVELHVVGEAKPFSRRLSIPPGECGR